ncbi:MAG: flagellar filament capping protein FliD, partial [Candidatus Margulisiibacteriota bacterium]
MGSSSSISGLSSGLDTENIIKGLMSIKRQHVDRLVAKKELEASKKDTWSTIMSHTLGLQLSAYNLSKTSTYNARKLTVSDDTIVNASVYGTATPGSYQFIAHKLATAQQVSSIGFHDYDTTPVGAGTLTVELGNGDVKRDTLLNELNGGKGVTRGKIKLTDREGAAATIDLTYAMTVDDVLKTINTSGIKVSAAINTSGSGFTLTATGGAGTLSAEEVLGGTTAADLGIKGSIVGNTLSGTSVAYLGSASSLDSLNDGLGISKAGLLINAIAVNLTSANTLGDVVTAVNNAATGVTASIRADGKGLRLTSGAAFTVAENGGTSASELGIQTLVATGDGADLYAGLNSVLLKDLNGASGITGTVFTIQGALNADVNISGMTSLRQVIDAINAQTGTTNVAAQYNSARNGLQLSSTTGANFTVVENTGAPAASLGILGTSSNGTLNGADLDLAYLSKNVALSTMNQGDGVRKGTIVITNKAGATLTVNLTSSTIKTLGNVIKTINDQSTGEGKGITVSINNTGDGLLVTDSSGGAGSLIISESSSGHMAKDLGILGSSTGTTLNGSFEKSLTVSSTYTLKDVQSAINSLGINVNATILNDGTTNPYRLNISSSKTGASGRMAIHSNISGLSLATSVEPQNSAVILGEPTSKNALFISNSTNDISTLIPGVKLSLKKASTTPVTLAITTDSESVVAGVKDFVD